MKRLLIFAAAVSSLMSGCATKALWEEGRFSRFHEPATPSNVALYRGMKPRTAIVAYDEQLETTQRRVRRTFTVDLDSDPPANPHRPRFISVRTNDLVRIPLGDAPLSSGLSAVTTNSMREFALYDNGLRILKYELPVYGDHSETAKQVALTPLAVTADATMIGSIVFLEWLGTGGWPR